MIRSADVSSSKLPERSRLRRRSIASTATVTRTTTGVRENVGATLIMQRITAGAIATEGGHILVRDHGPAHHRGGEMATSIRDGQSYSMEITGGRGYIDNGLTRRPQTGLGLALLTGLKKGKVLVKIIHM